MICFRCQETREHTYCARVKLESVPPMWLCEVCRRPNPSNVIDLATDPRANQVEQEAVDSEDSAEIVDQNAAQSSRTNQVVNNEAGPSSSRTNQVEKAVGNASDKSSS
ncbi:unnamed protein product [Microthlaspi erraticum]|uniref:Zinc finger PHD-type domain-containing protein n=1 Tax=Microthlaspi erraticum TaxID=1685480 RepID=A0A6D2IKX3_9BRAS|nr:unnamed protein product [Microthlaspi erraticum]